MCKYQPRRGFAAANPILLTEPAKSSLLPLLLPTLLLLKPLLLLTSQMATLGLTQRLWANAKTTKNAEMVREPSVWPPTAPKLTALEPLGCLPEPPWAPRGSQGSKRAL